MSTKLSSLVEAAKDPYLTLYVLANLGQGVPNHTCFRNALDHLQYNNVINLFDSVTQAERRLTEDLARDQVRDLQGRVLLDLQERQLTAQIFEQSSLIVLVRKLPGRTPEELREILAEKNPLPRFLAIQAIARRRLPMEADLLKSLQDDSPIVRQAAHEALVRICRGTDFGPRSDGMLPMRRAVGRWQQWLELQASARLAMGDNSTPAIARERLAIQQPPDPVASIESIVEASKGDPRLEDAETAALLKELTEAKAQEQSRVLERLQAGKGVQYSDALAQAIPRLQGALREQARQALTQRFARMKAHTLRDKMHEDDAEVRRAACAACVLKTAVEHVEDLIALLTDPEPAVVQAAHEALQKLTGKDHGPAVGATARERREAARAWRDWLRRRDHPDR